MHHSRVTVLCCVTPIISCSQPLCQPCTLQSPGPRLLASQLSSVSLSKLQCLDAGRHAAPQASSCNCGSAWNALHLFAVAQPVALSNINSASHHHAIRKVLQIGPSSAARGFAGPAVIMTPGQALIVAARPAKLLVSGQHLDHNHQKQHELPSYISPAAKRAAIKSVRQCIGACHKTLHADQQ